MSDEAARRRIRRARPFLCRYNIWHRWGERRVQLWHSGIKTTMKVCKRCHVAKGWR